MTLVLDGTSGVKFPDNSAQSVAASDGLGDGQTWQDVTASRVSGTTYTNSTGKPILVLFTLVVSGLSSTFSRSVSVNGVTITNSSTATSGIPLTASVVVPSGSTYSFICTASGGTNPSASFTIFELR